MVDLFGRHQPLRGEYFERRTAHCVKHALINFRNADARTGYELIDLRAEGPSRRDDVLAFYGDGAAVPPLVFFIKDMKGQLHNG